MSRLFQLVIVFMLGYSVGSLPDSLAWGIVKLGFVVVAFATLVVVARREAS